MPAADIRAIGRADGAQEQRIDLKVVSAELAIVRSHSLVMMPVQPRRS